jgi:hypothetical protein
MLMPTPLRVIEKELEVAQVEAKKKQLLAANKAAARLLLLGILSESRTSSGETRHNWNGDIE